MASEGDNGPESPQNDFSRWWIAALGLVFLVVVVGLTQFAWNQREEATSWTELKALVADDQIEKVTFEGEWVRAVRKGEERDGKSLIQVTRVQGDESFIALLESHGVEYTAVQPNPCASGSLTFLLLPLMMLAL
ncbi:MAG: ATP-dependent metallopeptidase FtsH/Yme1/Tma family protein, partial [Actinomycetota bacterium]